MTKTQQNTTDATAIKNAVISMGHSTTKQNPSGGGMTNKFEISDEELLSKAWKRGRKTAGKAVRVLTDKQVQNLIEKSTDYYYTTTFIRDGITGERHALRRTDSGMWLVTDSQESAKPNLKPTMEDQPETVDWDVQIEQLPPRRSEQVVVKFIQGYYRKPTKATGGDA